MLRGFTNLGVKMQALIASAILVLCVIALGVHALLAMGEIARSARDLHEHTLTKVRAVREVANDAVRTHFQVFRYVAWASNGANDSTLQSLDASTRADLRRVERGITALAERPDLSRTERRALFLLLNQWAEYAVTASHTLDVGGRDPALGSIMLGGVDLDYAAANAELQHMAKLASDQALASVRNLETSVESQRFRLISGLIISVTFVLAVLLALVFSLIRPIETVTRTMRAVSEGRVGDNVDLGDRGDEIGQMVQAIAVFRDSLERRERELATQNLRFDAAMNNMVQGLVVFDGDEGLVVANQRYMEIYKLDPDRVKAGISRKDIMGLRSAAGTAKLARLGAESRLPEEVLPNGARKFYNQLDDGRVVAITQCPLGNGWVSTHEDISDRLRDQQKIHTQNYQFQTLVDGMAQGLCMFDREQRLILCNNRYVEMFALPPDLAKPGVTLKQIRAHRVLMGSAPIGDAASFVNEVRLTVTGGKPHHYTVDLADGRSMAVRHMPMAVGGWVATHEDITEQRRSEAKIVHMARHDALTDLPNRMLFREHLEEALGRVRRSGEPLAVLCLDLDHFKEVNDTLGHPVGDLLLQAVTKRLERAVRETDTVARLGGDEFAILHAGVQPEAVSALARRLVEHVSDPYEIDGHQVVVGASIGIAVAPGDGLDADHLLKNADMALYRAKADGRSMFRYFEPEMDARAQARRTLEMDMRLALARGEFELYYQPLVATGTGEVSGFEALVRWHHPNRGIISPSEFIPVAEDTGLIVPLGEWVLRQACREAAEWNGDIKVAVNLSSVQFKSRNLVAAVVSALEVSQLAPHRLELEITETVLLQDSEATRAALHKLRGLGVRVALDDFGTGYSSLSYLRSFPFDKIKIDRSFVQDIGRNPESEAIIRAVTGLATNLGMATTAEGVETSEQLDRLRQQGCTQVQGFFFSPPVPASSVATLLETLASAAGSEGARRMA